jgi:putative transcriptional regulator
MPITVHLDVMLARRKCRLNDLAAAIDITPQNLSVLKSGRAKAIRFSTLEAICQFLQCQPADLLEYQPGPTPLPNASPTSEPGPGMDSMHGRTPDNSFTND